MMGTQANPFVTSGANGGVVSNGVFPGTGGPAGHHGIMRGGAGDTGHHSSYSTSTYSSMSGSECDRQHRRSHHLIRHSSLETINTQVRKNEITTMTTEKLLSNLCAS